MAYKRQSPLPINESGTNALSMANANGTICYDGNSLVAISPGSAGEVLTSNGGLMVPTYQPAPTGGTVSIIGATPIQGVSPGNTPIAVTAGKSWRMPFDAGANTTSQANTQFPMPLTGTFSKLYVWVFGNASTVDVTLILNVNSVNSPLMVTIPATMTGTFSDTTHSQAVVAGDLIQFEGSQSATGQVSGMISCQFSS